MVVLVGSVGPVFLPLSASLSLLAELTHYLWLKETSAKVFHAQAPVTRCSQQCILFPSQSASQQQYSTLCLAPPPPPTLPPILLSALLLCVCTRSVAHLCELYRAGQQATQLQVGSRPGRGRAGREPWTHSRQRGMIFEGVGDVLGVVAGRWWPNSCLVAPAGTTQLYAKLHNPGAAAPPRA